MESPTSSASPRSGMSPKQMLTKTIRDDISKEAHYAAILLREAEKLFALVHNNQYKLSDFLRSNIPENQAIFERDPRRDILDIFARAASVVSTLPSRTLKAAQGLTPVSFSGLSALHVFMAVLWEFILASYFGKMYEGKIEYYQDEETKKFSKSETNIRPFTDTTVTLASLLSTVVTIQPLGSTQVNYHLISRVSTVARILALNCLAEDRRDRYVHTVGNAKFRLTPTMMQFFEPQIKEVIKSNIESQAKKQSSQVTPVSTKGVQRVYHPLVNADQRFDYNNYAILARLLIEPNRQFIEKPSGPDTTTNKFTKEDISQRTAMLQYINNQLQQKYEADPNIQWKKNLISSTLENFGELIQSPLHFYATFDADLLSVLAYTFENSGWQ